MQMVYQENSIPSNQQVKNNRNLHFRATIQSLMNRKERRKWQTYERIDFHWQLVRLVLYSTLMSWNSGKKILKLWIFIFFFNTWSHIYFMNQIYALFLNYSIFFCISWMTNKKNPGAFAGCLLNIYFRLGLLWMYAISSSSGPEP